VAFAVLPVNAPRPLPTPALPPLGADAWPPGLTADDEDVREVTTGSGSWFASLSASAVLPVLWGVLLLVVATGAGCGWGAGEREAGEGMTPPSARPPITAASATTVTTPPMTSLRVLGEALPPAPPLEPKPNHPLAAERGEGG
jgi:hypothetical protein